MGLFFVFLSLALLPVVLFLAWRLVVWRLNRKCLFCAIVEGRAAAKIVLRSSDAVVFHDIKPLGEIHLLAVPTSHVDSIHKLRAGKTLEILEEAARQALASLGVKYDSKRVDMHFV